jgi:hypothetical protein
VLLDLVYAARTLRRGRVLAFVAVATIALGIGASTAVFTVAEAVLLRPLPYWAAARLVVATVEMRRISILPLFLVLLCVRRAKRRVPCGMRGAHPYESLSDRVARSPA